MKFLPLIVLCTSQYAQSVSAFSQRVTAAAAQAVHVEEGSMDRRQALVAAYTLPAVLLGQSPATANAAANSDSASTPTTLTAQSILQGLRTVPTFCIVNDEGAAYMLYKRAESFAKGYAFLTYDGATVVLKDAIETAEKGGYADTWKQATITVVPADAALRLTIQPKERRAVNKPDVPPASTILFLIPGAADREAALQLDRTKFQDQGKVPLFYLDTFRTGDKALPLYFSANDLIQAWRQQQEDLNAIPPRIQVIDLVTLFGYVVRGRATELPTVLQTNRLVFVPRVEVVEKAKTLQKEGLAPYKLDLMVV